MSSNRHLSYNEVMHGQTPQVRVMLLELGLLSYQNQRFEMHDISAVWIYPNNQSNTYDISEVPLSEKSEVLTSAINRRKTSDF